MALPSGVNKSLAFFGPDVALLCDCVQRRTPSSNPNVGALRGVAGKRIAHWAVLRF